MKRYYIVFFALLTSCVSDFDEYEPSLLTSEIDPRLQEYYDAFFYEAEIRGVHLPKEPIKMVFLDSVISAEGVRVAGTSNRKAKLVQIDINLLNSLKWSKSNAINLEYVVFHELGHYVLGRGHDDSENPDGTVRSMMHHIRRAYSVTREDRREYYLDELFEN